MATNSNEFLKEVNKQVEKRLQEMGMTLPIPEETIRGYIDALSNTNLLQLLADTDDSMSG